MVAPGHALAEAIRLLPARDTSPVFVAAGSRFRVAACYRSILLLQSLSLQKGGVHIHQIALELAARILCPGTGSVSIDTRSLSFFYRALLLLPPGLKLGPQPRMAT